VHSAKCLKAKKLYCVFHTPKNNVLACILVLITNLLKSIEHGQNIKNKKKIFCVVLVSGIMNLYVKYIPNIKKVFSFDNIEQLGIYPLR
jgi:hypothetical protein